MTNPLSVSPLLYQPSLEKLEHSEADTVHSLLETLQKINESTCRDGNCSLRSVHAKSHGLLTGELRILDKLPPQLAQGVFAMRARKVACDVMSGARARQNKTPISEPRALPQF